MAPVATPTPSELREADDAILAWSVIRDANQMAPGRVDGLVRNAIRVTAVMAQRELGTRVRLVARDMLASDMPNRTTNTWVETSAAAGTAWAQAAFATGGSIADNTFIGIYGFQMLNLEDANTIYGSDKEIVSGIRFIVGGTRVAQWEIAKLHQLIPIAATPANGYGPSVEFKTGISESPVIITQNKTLEIQFWEVTAGTIDFIPVMLGVVVEPVGLTLNP